MLCIYINILSIFIYSLLNYIKKNNVHAKTSQHTIYNIYYLNIRTIEQLSSAHRRPKTQTHITHTQTQKNEHNKLNC